MEECGGVRIRFPPNTDSKSDEVNLHGPKEDVERAKTHLLELANEQVREGEVLRARNTSLNWGEGGREGQDTLPGTG